MKKAVAYCRFSSDNQREESILAQFRAIEKYCEQKNIKLIKMYKDEALSARTDDRPSFLQMIKDSDLKEFDCVIVHKLDRFSRNRYDSALYKRKLKANGVKLISVLENLDGSPESIIMESLLEGMSEYYSANLSREVTKGLKENAYQCKFNGGNVPYGYRVENQVFVLDEKEAPVVKRIFEMYSSGYSFKKIADILNSEGLRTKKGALFTKGSFKVLISNSIYYGLYTYKIKDEIIKIEGGIPAIITKDFFDYVQDLKSKRYLDLSNSTTYKYLLTGLLFQDGKPLIGTCGTAKSGKVHHYYRVKGKSKHYRADKLEHAIKSLIKDVLFFKPNIENLIDLIHQGILEATKDDVKISSFKKELLQISNKINNIVKAVADGFASDALRDELNSLEKRKSEIEIELSKMKLNNKIEKKDIEKFMKSYENRLDSIDDLKIILHQLISKIEIDTTGAMTVELKNIKGSYDRVLVGHRGLEPRTYRL